MTFRLAWRNIWRQPRRTLLNAVAIALVTSLMIFLPSFQDGSYRAMIHAATSLLDGTAQLQRSGYLDNPSLRQSFPVTPDLRVWLDRNLPPDSFAERAATFALLSGKSRSFGAQIVGVQPERDAFVSSVPRRIVHGRYLQHGDEIILGQGLADNLKVGVGDPVTLIGTGRDGSLSAATLAVVGIFQSAAPELDRNLAEMPLARFDDVFALQGQRNAIVFNAAAAARIDAVPAQFGDRDLAARTWRELQPGLLQAIHVDIGGSVLVYVILVLVICLSLLNSVLMSTLERTREFGMMLALGIKPALLARVVWIENALILVGGVGAGSLLGAGVTLWLAHHGINFASSEAIFAKYGIPSTLYPHLTGLTLTLGPLVIASLALMLGFYPSIRVRHLTAIEAMRAV